MKVPISAIKGLDAYRKDIGDITGLAASITKDGLLNPVILTKDDRLISGSRRIAATRHNGSTVIDAVAVKDRTDTMESLEREKANGADVNARPLVLSEIVRQAEIIAAVPKRDGVKQQGFLLRDRLSAYYGYQRQTLRRALIITRAADDPSATAHVKELCAEMDAGGVIGSVLRKLTQTGSVSVGGTVPALETLAEQRAALAGAARRAEAFVAILPRIREITSRMPQEELAEYDRILSAGRTVLTQTLAVLRKAKK